MCSPFIGSYSLLFGLEKKKSHGHLAASPKRRCPTQSGPLSKSFFSLSKITFWLSSFFFFSFFFGLFSNALLLLLLLFYSLLWRFFSTSFLYFPFLLYPSFFFFIFSFFLSFRVSSVHSKKVSVLPSGRRVGRRFRVSNNFFSYCWNQHRLHSIELAPSFIQFHSISFGLIGVVMITIHSNPTKSTIT